MKKLLMVLAVLLIASVAQAAPFLVCDPQYGVTSYTLTGLPTDTTAEAQVDGSLRYDLFAVQSGTYNVQISACNVWGCSANVPFAFTKALPTPPVGVMLSK